MRSTLGNWNDQLTKMHFLQECGEEEAYKPAQFVGKNKHISTDSEPPTEGGVPILFFNAVLTDDSMFHNDTAT